MIIPLHPAMPQVCTRVLTIAPKQPRRAVVLANRMVQDLPTDPDAHTLAWARYTLAWTWLCWERLPEAQEWLALAQSAWMALDDTMMLLHCSYAQLIIQHLQGSNEELPAKWGRLATDYVQVGDLLAAARCRYEQIAHLNLLGRPRDALALIEQVEPIVQRTESLPDQARFAHVQGVALGSIGDLEGAVDRLEHARALYTHLKRPVDAAKSLFELAWLRQRYEQFDVAHANLEQAAAIFQHYDLPLRIALCQKDLGLVASRQGDFAAALAATVQAQMMFASLERRDQFAHCDMHLGIIAYYSGLYELALAAYRRAQETYADLGNQQLFLVNQRNQAMVACAQNLPSVALEILRTIEDSVRTLGDALELAEVLMIKARAARSLRQTAQAMQYIQAAHRQFLSCGNHAAAAECLLEQGWLFLEDDDLMAAERSLHEANRYLRDRPIHRWRVLYGLGRIAQQRDDTAAACAYCFEACHLVAMMRRQLASEYASSGLFVQAQQLFMDALYLAANQHDAMAILRLAEEQRALSLQRQRISNTWAGNPALQFRYEQQRVVLGSLLNQNPPLDVLNAAMLDYIDLLLQAHHSSMPVANDLDEGDFDINLLRAHLSAAYPQGWSILSCVVCQQEVLLVTIDAERVHLTRIDYDAKLQRLLVQTCERRYRIFTYMDVPHLRGQTDTAWAALATLGEQLLPRHLREQLHPHFRLIIIPGGILHSLPWCALRIDAAWLCQQAVIHYLPSLRFWRGFSQPADQAQAALLIGCSEFGERAPHLPHALPSLDVAQTHWHGAVTRLEHNNATRETLLALSHTRQLRSYKLIHIASHAQLVAAHGLLAHIKLFDDDLLLDEIMRLSLDGALVVLVACEGSLGDILPGDEVMSLSHALVAAGAGGVIASLWQIYDQVILDLLEPLYKALSHGDDPATAIAYTQRHLIAQSLQAMGTEQPFYSPLVWASVRYIGTTSW